jgi:hypothetical protein
LPLQQEQGYIQEQEQEHEQGQEQDGRQEARQQCLGSWKAEFGGKIEIASIS